MASLSKNETRRRRGADGIRGILTVIVGFRIEVLVRVFRKRRHVKARDARDHHLVSVVACYPSTPERRCVGVLIWKLRTCRFRESWTGKGMERGSADFNTMFQWYPRLIYLT